MMLSVNFNRYIFYISLISFLALPFYVGAFGVSPPFINQNKLVPGSTYTKTIFLVRSSDTKDLKIEAEFDLPDEIKEWVSTDKGESFIIPQGTRKFPVDVKIEVPEDAELGKYSGFLRFKGIPKEQESEGKTQVTVATGARVNINMTVGDNVIQDFSVGRVDILDIKEGENPQIIVDLENKGNVNVSLDRATLELFGKFGEVRLGYGQTENLPEVSSFESESFKVEFPIDIGLSPGEYWATAKVYKDREVVGSAETVFNVIEKEFSPLAWGGGVLLLLGLAGASVYVRKKYLKSNK